MLIFCPGNILFVNGSKEGLVHTYSHKHIPTVTLKTLWEIELKWKKMQGFEAHPYTHTLTHRVKEKDIDWQTKGNLLKSTYVLDPIRPRMRKNIKKVSKAKISLSL